MGDVILTERNYQHYASFHNVYEWEDVFSERLNLPIKNFYDGILSKPERLLKKAIYRQDLVKPSFSYNPNLPLKYKWIISAKGYREFTGVNVIPMFIDFPISMMEEIIEATKKLPFFFVSVIDVKDALIKNGCRNVHYMPMSVADKWYDRVCPQKKIDVVQVGRRNERLHDYMLAYAERHKDVDYVYVANSNFEYYSTKRDAIIGKVDTREEFMELLGESKISLVSTPGADGTSRFGVMDFVPVRFYECASRYCHMIGRYSDNEEIRMLGISDICDNVHSQSEFDKTLNRKLQIDCRQNVDKYDSFLQENITSKRVNDFQKIINAAREA